MGDSSPQLNRVQSSTSSSDSRPSPSPSPSQPPSQVKSPPKKKKPPTYYHSSALWVGGVGGGTAVLDRRYNLPRPKEPGTPVHRTQAQHGRTHSLSSTSLTPSTTNTSSGIGAVSIRDDSFRHPYAFRHGRRYLADPSARYPLPVDLPELNRQVLRTMLLVNIFGSPLISPNFRNKPPKKVLEIGCGNGYWSALCHRHFAQQGHRVSFTGIDIAPLSPENNVDGMKWRFVQHDLRKVPMPFKDEEFDFIMVKDTSLVTSALDMATSLTDEYLRILCPGGSIEFWDGDHSIRMLLSHNPSHATQDSNSEDEKEAQAEATGTYLMTTQTPFTETQNQYLTDYNTWLNKVLSTRGLDAMPCTSMASLLLQEPDLVDCGSRRLAIPLGEVRWEREGTEGSLKGKEAEAGKKVLTTGQAALRQTALLTVIQFIESMEPFLRDVSGKSQNEWNRWYGDMMNDLLVQNGTSWGECLEIGAGWATKKTAPPKVKPKPSLERSMAAENRTSYPPDPHPGNEWKIPKMDLLDLL